MKKGFFKISPRIKADQQDDEVNHRYTLSTWKCLTITYTMDTADRMYSKLLALITDPPNLSPYTHLWAHISAYMFFSVFPTNGHLAADKEAQEHVESIFELLDDDNEPRLSPKWKGKGKQVDFDEMDTLN